MMAVLGLRVCHHRSARSSYRRLYSAITPSVDNGIGPDNTRRALHLHQTEPDLVDKIIKSHQRKFAHMKLDDIYKGGRPHPLIAGGFNSKANVCPLVLTPELQFIEELRRISGNFPLIKIHRTCPGEMEDVVKRLEMLTGSVVVGQMSRIIYRNRITKMKAEEEKKKQARRIFSRRVPKSRFTPLESKAMTRPNENGCRGSSRALV